MKSYAVPIAIVGAGLLIAGAVVWSGFQGGTSGTGAIGGGEAVNTPAVTGEDFIRGNPDARIVIVEYSDLDCPFCKVFHATMKQLMEEYGKDGQIAWVYRHFPLTSLHPNAERHAIAAECAGKIGGNDAFWKFVDALIAANPGNQQADPSRYGEWAVAAGVDAGAFASCVEKADTAAAVKKEAEDAIAAGGTGTPYNVFLIKGASEPVAIPGALPYDNMKGLIEQVLDGKAPTAP